MHRKALHKPPMDFVVRLELDTKGWHSLEDGLHRLYCVREDYFLVPISLLVIIASLMKDSQLLENRGLYEE